MSIRITGYNIAPGTRQQPAIINRLNRPLTKDDPQLISITISLTNDYGVDSVGVWPNFEITGETRYTNGIFFGGQYNDGMRLIVDSGHPNGTTYTAKFYYKPGEVVLKSFTVRELKTTWNGGVWIQDWGRVLETVNIDRSYIIQTFTPEVKYEIKGATLSRKSLHIIQEAMLRIGEQRVTVTSMRRTPADQSRVMFENIINSSSFEKGISDSLIEYDKIGDKVVLYFKKEMTKSTSKDPVTGVKTAAYYSMNELLAKKDHIVSGGVALINQLGPSKVSKHCLSDADAKKLQVFDIAPSSLDSLGVDTGFKFHSIFVSPSTRDPAVKGFLSPFTPNKDTSFHFEIAQ